MTSEPAPLVPLFGRSARSHAVPRFRVSETEHDAGELAEHAHGATCFCLVVAGGFAELGRGKRAAICPGR